MFFRRKSAPRGCNWQLVESFRNAEGQPRQRIVVSLGCASLPEDELKFIAKVLERKLRHQRDFFSQQQDAAQLSEEAAWWVDRIYRKIARAGRFCQPQSVGDTEGMPPSSPPSTAPGSPPDSPGLIETVRLNEIEHENSSMLGPLLPVKAAWESLRISQCLQDLGFSRKQIAAAAATVMSRLIDPSSEYALVRWIPTTALPELLGDAVLGFDHKGFYRISDKLLKNHPGKVKVLIELAYLYFRLDNMKKSREIVKIAERKDSNFYKLYHIKALLYQKEGERQKAERRRNKGTRQKAEGRKQKGKGKKAEG